MLYLIVSLSILVSYQDGTAMAAARIVLADHGYPLFEDAPDAVFITILGSQNTIDLTGHEFSDEAIEAALKKVFFEADSDADTFLNMKELALWLHKNDKLNSAAEIKKEFKKMDANMDAKVTLIEAIENSWDEASQQEYRANFILKNGEMDLEKLNGEELPRMDLEGHPSEAHNIQNSYKIFVIADADKDGGLSWEEFVVYMRPEEFPETSLLAIGEEHHLHDDDKDGKISLEEFRQYYHDNLLIPELIPEKVRKPEDMFAKCDSDNDGFISYAESAACTKGYFSVNHWEPDSLMQEADTNNDSKLSVEEIIAVFEDIEATDYYWESKEEL